MLTILGYFLIGELFLFSFSGALILVYWAIMRIWDVTEFTGRFWKFWEFLEKLLLTLGFLLIPWIIFIGILTLIEVGV